MSTTIPTSPRALADHAEFPAKPLQDAIEADMATRMTPELAAAETEYLWAQAELIRAAETAGGTS